MGELTLAARTCLSDGTARGRRSPGWLGRNAAAPTTQPLTITPQKVAKGISTRLDGDGKPVRRQAGPIAQAARPGHIIASLLALSPGTRLGVYEVTALLGEGGMGQVDRATDTRLKRQVAIKILPPSVAADHDRLARFQREAEVVASLNHPNIAAIYGLEESREMSALVMDTSRARTCRRSSRVDRSRSPRRWRSHGRSPMRSRRHMNKASSIVT